MAKKLYMPFPVYQYDYDLRGLSCVSEAGFFFCQSEESIQQSPTLQNSFASRCPYFSYWIWITAKSDNLHYHSHYWISPAPTPSEKPPFQPEVTYYPVAKSGKTLSGKRGGGGRSEKCFLDPVSAWSENKGGRGDSPSPCYVIGIISWLTYTNQ